MSFGLFGPNGAGKTTLISLITGVLKLQSGRVEIFGEDIKNRSNRSRMRLGFVPQNLSFFEELSPNHNLQYFGSMLGLDSKTIAERSDSLLQVLGLYDVRNQPVKSFSGGMKRRVNLAIGVLHQPDLLFLDEPTVGVDVQTRHAIIAYLKELNASGMTIFYTSHHLSEAQELCDSVALMDEGRIVANDSLDQLLDSHGQASLEELFLKLTGKEYRDQ